MDAPAAQIGLKANPFTFNINPELFVGYNNEVTNILSNIESGCKLCLLLGPTGSGKTSLLKYMTQKVGSYRHIIYLAKPPKDYNDWVKIFEGRLRPGLLSRVFSRGPRIDIYQLSDYVNQKLGSDRCLLFVDEAHEASVESLEWLRALTDQIENLVVVMAGLPVFENMLNDSLETFMKRISLKVVLSNLTKSETRELIKKRIESAGGDDIRPFTQESISLIYDKTGGFPREIIKLCSALMMQAAANNLTTIDVDFVNNMKSAAALADPRVSVETLNNLPEKQKNILKILSEKGEVTPSELAESVELDIYKDKDNAIRSMNNILKRLMDEGLVERKGTGKSFRYKVSEKFRTLKVTA